MLIILYFYLLVLVGCAEDVTRFTLIDSLPEVAGAHCVYGGVRFDAGVDLNEDGVLQPAEVSEVSYACNARVDGRTSLTLVREVQPGSQGCEYGGQVLSSGLDVNDDGVLQQAEVTSISYLCNGNDGFDTLVNLVHLDPDPQGACFFGGTRIESGLDANRDGELDEGEVSEVEFVCAVHVNENMTLVENSPEVPGANCEYGGVRMDVGYDRDGDHILGLDEIEYTGYLCNEVILVDGKTSLVATQPASLAQCPEGGYELSTGLDHNYNGVLDAREILSAVLVCNGTQGLTTLVESQVYSGSECGEVAGFVYHIGFDENANWQLDSREIRESTVICDGQTGQGEAGHDGVNSLIEVTDDTLYCGPAGGIRIDVGLDWDEDGILDPAEVESSSYVCIEAI